MDKPRYYQTEKITFLGQWKEYDLYLDENAAVPVFIARYGHKEDEMLQGHLVAIEQHEVALKGGMILPLGMAVTKAKLQGLYEHTSIIVS